LFGNKTELSDSVPKYVKQGNRLWNLQAWVKMYFDKTRLQSKQATWQETDIIYHVMILLSVRKVQSQARWCHIFPKFLTVQILSVYANKLYTADIHLWSDLDHQLH
jgi:hypothetical protein